ncbi:glycosyltransferase [Odoribacter lunatus]|uniref:glycosyltransferase n=1 Tax=Odoribacter lunatus TaxID=2941335 RepID=UPI002041485A|nr:glycosyltransferase [Odoribacter lunatus]
MDIFKKISVIMCTYNGIPYIEQQLNSIVTQTYPIHELIIQDDGSTDSTIETIHRFQSRYPYIQLFQNEKHLGINQNFFSAMERATGEYIAISDQDDIWLANKLEKQIEHIGKHDICFSAYYVDDVYSDNLKQIRIPIYNIESQIFGNYIAGHTMLIRKDLIQKVNLPAPVCYDYWLAICAHFHHGIIQIDEPLNWRRLHKLSATALINQKHNTPNFFTPYFQGIIYLNKLRHNENWHYFLSYIYNQSQQSSLQLTQSLYKYLMKNNIFALFHLCYLCLIYKNLIYPQSSKGPLSYFRAFFFPFIYAYHHHWDFCSF